MGGRIWGKNKVTMKMKIKATGHFFYGFGIFGPSPKPDTTPKFQNPCPIIAGARGPRDPSIWLACREGLLLVLLIVGSAF